MKPYHLALFALAAAFTAGCTPKNGPSGYDADDRFPTGPSPAPTPPIEQTPGLPERPTNNGGEKSFKPSDINPAAIVAVVHFGFDKYHVEAGERAKLDAAIASLKGKKIICAGYSDHFGTVEYNLGLSDKRAHSVQSYLGKSGVTDTDIRAFGEQFANPSGDKNAVADDRKVIVIDTEKL